MLRRTETRRRPSKAGEEVGWEGETVRSLSEISASWVWYLRKAELIGDYAMHDGWMGGILIC